MAALVFKPGSPPLERIVMKMDWTEIVIETDADDIDRAGDIAQMVVPYGIYMEDYRNLEREAWEIAHIDLIDEALLKKRPLKRPDSRLSAPRRKPGGSARFFKRAVSCRRHPPPDRNGGLPGTGLGK